MKIPLTPKLKKELEAGLLQRRANFDVLLGFGEESMSREKKAETAKRKAQLEAEFGEGAYERQMELDGNAKKRREREEDQEHREAIKRQQKRAKDDTNPPPLE